MSRPNIDDDSVNRLLAQLKRMAMLHPGIPGRDAFYFEVNNAGFALSVFGNGDILLRNVLTLVDIVKRTSDQTAQRAAVRQMLEVLFPPIFPRPHIFSVDIPFVTQIGLVGYVYMIKATPSPSGSVRFEVRAIPAKWNAIRVKVDAGERFDWDTLAKSAVMHRTLQKDYLRNVFLTILWPERVELTPVPAVWEKSLSEQEVKDLDDISFGHFGEQEAKFAAKRLLNVPALSLFGTYLRAPVVGLLENEDNDVGSLAEIVPDLCNVALVASKFHPATWRWVFNIYQCVNFPARTRVPYWVDGLASMVICFVWKGVVNFRQPALGNLFVDGNGFPHPFVEKQYHFSISFDQMPSPDFPKAILALANGVTTRPAGMPVEEARLRVSENFVAQTFFGGMEYEYFEKYLHPSFRAWRKGHFKRWQAFANRDDVGHPEQDRRWAMFPKYWTYFVRIFLTEVLPVGRVKDEVSRPGRIPHKNLTLLAMRTAPFVSFLAKLATSGDPLWSDKNLALVRDALTADPLGLGIDNTALIAKWETRALRAETYVKGQLRAWFDDLTTGRPRAGFLKVAEATGDRFRTAAQAREIDDAVTARIAAGAGTDVEKARQTRLHKLLMSNRLTRTVGRPRPGEDVRPRQLVAGLGRKVASFLP